MKKIAILVIGIALIFATGFLYIMLNRTSQGFTQAERDKALTALLGRKLKLTDTKTDPDYTEYKGKYLSFSYPSNTKPFDDQNKSDGPYYSKSSLDGYIASSENPFLWMSVQVYKADQGGLEDYSAIRVRELDPNTYQKSDVVINGVKGLLFIKTGASIGKQKEAFCLVNEKIYMILVQSSSEDLLNTVFNKITSTIKFY